MRKRFLFAVAALASTAGCINEGQQEKVEFTSFIPTPTGFSYKGHASAAFPIDTSSGEAWRLSVLGEYMADNHICPNGYEIVDRRPLLVTRAPFGDVYDVWYTGRCK